MENWKDEIYEHIKGRKDLVTEVNQAVNSVVEELKSNFDQELELVKRNTKVELPKNISQPKWVMSIGDFIIEFDLQDVKDYRSTQDDYGNMVFDETIKIDEALKELIKRRITNM